MLSILYFHRQYYNLQNNIARFANLKGVRQKKNNNLCTVFISMVLFPESYLCLVPSRNYRFIFYYQCD